MILLGVVMDRPWASNVGFVALIIGLALYFRAGSVRREPTCRIAKPPVVGRWAPVNSPGTRVPSHGLHAWGQTYAIDLVHAPSAITGRNLLDSTFAPCRGVLQLRAAGRRTS